MRSHSSFIRCFILTLTHRSLSISVDELSSDGCWCICGWWTIVCGPLLGVFNFDACLNRLRLKKSDRTAFNLPEQMSFAEMVSKPPTWFCLRTARQASTFSYCKEEENDKMMIIDNLLNLRIFLKLFVCFFFKLKVVEIFVRQ